ncbi:MAG: cell wall-binding repeat-containing protein [Nakamurella sp.]
MVDDTSPATGTLYAIWKLVSYTVTLDTQNGGADSTQQVKPNEFVTAPTADPTKAGFTFQGWFTGTAGTGTAWNFSSDTVTGPTTLYASWVTAAAPPTSTGSVQPPAAAPVVTAPALPERVAGTNRYDTAAQIAAQFVAADGHFSGNIVIANGEDAKSGFDALSANYLAGLKDGPILLSQSSSLPSSTVDAIKNLYPTFNASQAGTSVGTIYVMGLTPQPVIKIINNLAAALSETSGVKVNVVQVAGPDRYATSAAAATLPGTVQAAISKLGVKQVVILGGTDRVSAAVAAHLAASGITVKRIAGSGSEGRYGTAASLATLALSIAPEVFAAGPGAIPVYLVNGQHDFADALSAGPLVGVTGGLLLPVSDSQKLPAPIAQLVAKAADGIGSVTALGGLDNVVLGALIQVRTIAGLR